MLKLLLSFITVVSATRNHKLRLLVVSTRASRESLPSMADADDLVAVFKKQMAGSSQATAAVEQYIAVYVNSFNFADVCNAGCAKVAKVAQSESGKGSLIAAKEELYKDITHFLSEQAALIGLYQTAESANIKARYVDVVESARMLKFAARKVDKKKWLISGRQFSEIFIVLSRRLILMTQATASFCQVPVDDWLSTSLYGGNLYEKVRGMANLLVAACSGMFAAGTALERASTGQALLKHRIIDKLEVIADMEFSFIEALVNEFPELFHRDLPATLVKYNSARATWGTLRKKLMSEVNPAKVYPTMHRQQIVKTLCALRMSELLV